MPDQPATWEVVSQMEVMEPGFNNQITRGMRVYYKTSLGGQGSVFIPEAQYSDVNVVREILKRSVEANMAVHQLKG